MSVSTTKIHPSFIKYLFFTFLSLQLFSSCTVVKKYQPYKPFVFKNNIDIKTDLRGNAVSELRTKLEGQIEDSVKPVFKSIVFIRNVMTSPPVFDSNDVKQTVLNMNYLLHNNGYYRSRVTADWSRVDTVAKKNNPDQYRVHVSYHIETDKPFIIDTINYIFSDPNLQKINEANIGKSLLKKSARFNRQLVDEELNRLMELFKDNGYYNISREIVKAQLDTIDVSLIDVSLDPFEQLQRQLEAGKRRENPTISISILQIPVKDTSIFTRYRVGRVSIFPDVPPELAGLRMERNTLPSVQHEGYNIFSRYNLFKNDFLTNRVLLKPGSLYRVSDYNRTLLKFNRIESWQSVNINSRASDSTGTVDFSIRMVPAKKYFFSVDFEGSSILTAQDQIFNAGNKGLALNFNFKNRNVAKRALQLENVLRTGIEFTDFKRILSSEIGLRNRLIFPSLLLPFFDPEDERDFLNAKTYISLDGSYIDRYQFYKINTLNAYLGYEFQRKANETWQVRFPNLEYTRIYDKDTGFNRLISDYPLLEYSYNDGLIIGTNATYTRRFSSANPMVFSMLKIYAEESGLLTGALLKQLTEPGKVLSNLYRFVKLSADYRRYYNMPKTSWAFRAFAGYGIGFETESRKGDVSLPFFRQFFGGGPNSMRGWHLRKLGPGSSIFYDTVRFRTYTIDPPGVIEKRYDDRYADIQLEANVEYRFDIFPVYGYWLKGALFTDIGNVWIRRSHQPEFEYGVFKLNRLYTDIAIAGGGGLRLDFKFFLLRFDLGWRLKDPLYASNGHAAGGGWFIGSNMKTPTFQFGIGYPF
ncbi:MAG: BamA/TamA family outer membrane protein [Chitinophagaceae bacterium]|nr:BamA/TamA family outer membrane protein [Chitinophagaceae bacterium]MCW5929443.1 BamA/TamA family outer membrane protein [Chitinophagaceae bacterium]